MGKAILTPIDNPEKVVKASNCIKEDGETVEHALSKHYDYANAGSLINFTSTKTHTATQDCLFSFYAVAQGAVNAFIKINNTNVMDALYMAGLTSSQYVSMPMAYPLRKGDVLSITVNSGTISDLKGREIPLSV